MTPQTVAGGPAVRVDPAATGPRTVSDVLGRFASGVTVLVTGRGDDAHAMTCSAFSTASIDPPLVLACVRRGSRFLSRLQQTNHFCVTILGEQHDGLARWFASRTRPADARQFDGLPCSPAPATGCLGIDAGIARLECVVSVVQPAGDHHIVIGAVLTAQRMRGRPLVRYERELRRLA